MKRDCEIKKRIIKGKKVVGALNPVLWPRNISNNIKQLLYNDSKKSDAVWLRSGVKCTLQKETFGNRIGRHQK